MLDKLNIESKFKDNLPSQSWVYCFLQRFPELSSRIPENLGTARANVTRENIEKWFATLENFVTTELEEDPQSFFNNDENWSRIFNLDETGFPLAGSSGGAKLKVLAEKGSKSVIRITPETKEQITVLGNVCANGQFYKPLILFPGQTYRATNITSLKTEDANKISVGISDSGWMTGETFFSYIANCFYDELLSNKVHWTFLTHQYRIVRIL